ncbi:GNAT family N-acetyltransferase [Rheinheimera sp.]|uniref:GNAT family N-acetyltransferase n=1 Tax=Rheinheimera sp. TaxID=1869214 RepID=UPI0027BA4EAC|nr:GNAT family N-acetyltransferase [Rheinheimera sp.]
MKPQIQNHYQQVKDLNLFAGQQTSFFAQAEWFYRFEQAIANTGEPRWFIQQPTQDQTLCFPALALPAKKGQGRQLQGMSNYYSPYFDLMAKAPYSEQQLVDFFAAFRHELKTYDTLNIVPCLADKAELWCKALRQIGFHSHIYQHSTNWYHPDIKDLDDFWAKRPSRLRHTLQRKKEKTLHSGQYSCHIFSTGSRQQLWQFLIDYHHCYRNSWKNVEPNPGFIDAIAELAWQQGKLRLGIVYHLDKPVAAQIWFSEGSTASIFKLAHDKAYTKHSVGTVLTSVLAEHVISQDKISCLDFLTGDDDYKQDWMTHKRPLYGVQSCNLTSMYGLSAALRNEFSKLKHQFFKR